MSHEDTLRDNVINYKHIRFEVSVEKPKTRVWDCLNNSRDDLLGEVRWHAPWRQYCFFPDHQIVFSPSCLRDITSFLNRSNIQHKKAWE